MQDDCYSISADGWKAETERIIEKDKNGRTRDKGWVCDLIPKPYIVARFFQKEQNAIDELIAEREQLEAKITELEEEHGGEEGPFNGVTKKADAITAWQEAFDAVWQERFPDDYAAYSACMETEQVERARRLEMSGDPRIEALKNSNGKFTITAVRKAAQEANDEADRAFFEHFDASDKAAKEAKKAAKELADSAGSRIRTLLEENPHDESLTDLRILTEYLQLGDEVAAIKSRIKEAEAKLDALAYEKYPQLTEDEVKTLVIDDKWMKAIDQKVHGEMDRISQALASRVKELAERYEAPMPQLVERVSHLENRVNRHLAQMGFAV
jgi:type I restriction enzyme M protein